MRKVVLLALVSLLLSTAVVVGFVRPVAASLRVHNIDTDLDYATIQEAINAPQTLDGHTIVVDAGTYYEHVVVNKSVTLVGEDSSTTIIDGNGTWMVVQSNTSDVEIRGFTVQNGGYPYSGIQIGGCVNNTIRDCIIRNNVYGIELYESNDSIVVGNKIMNSSWAGIYVRNSNNNDIHDNIIIENSLGVWITSASSTFNKLYHNNFINNSNHAQSLSLNTKWDNGAEGNYWDDYSGNDANRDGIGDTPYLDIIGGINKDEYPLIEQWSLFRTLSYNVTTFCNSTVASFKFNQSLRQISFNVTGPSGNMSFCNVTIPNTLLGGVFTVYVDDNSTEFTQVDNATHTSLYFTFEFLSTRKVKIIATEVGSSITVSVDPATVTVGSEVTINGTITPVRVDVNVTISYRLSGGTWSTLATVTTDSDSCYTYIWTTTETGTYEIKTSWEGDNNTLPSESEILTIKVSLPPVVFPVIVDGLEFNVVVESSSTVSDFDFRQDEMEICFSVTGPDGTIGFCNVTIPQALLGLESPGDVWVVLIDGETDLLIDLLITENVTHTLLYFTYPHTTRNIRIRGTWVIPEFPTLLPLLLTLAILAVSTIILKRRPLKTPLR